MSIFAINGNPVTMLQLYGAPGKTIGMSFRRPVFQVTLYLPIAGPVPTVFTNPLQFCQVANAGIQIIVYVLDQFGNDLDISGATGLIYSFLGPDGAIFTRTPTRLTNGMDGGLIYTSTATDFALAGPWDVQAKFTTLGNINTTKIGQFIVQSNIQ